MSDDDALDHVMSALALVNASVQLSKALRQEQPHEEKEQVLTDLLVSVINEGRHSATAVLSEVLGLATIAVIEMENMMGDDSALTRLSEMIISGIAKGEIK